MNQLSATSRAVLLLALAGAAAPVSACSTPVFQYALENWASEPYRVTIFHRGPLDEKSLSAVNVLRGSGAANVELQLADLAAKPPAPLRALWAAHEHASLPLMLVRFPVTHKAVETLWSGPLTVEAAKTLVDSPARREIAKRILAGDAVVWVLLGGGDEAKDRAAERKLAARLETLSDILRASLAPGVDQSGQEAAQAARVRFSVLKISPGDSAERMFAAMLVGCESDLKSREYASEPMAFPVFGRGRVLYALVGGGITDANIQRACETLIGPCTCELKDENPGMDLLLATDWDALVTVSDPFSGALAPLGGLPVIRTTTRPRDPLPPSGPALQGGLDPAPTASDLGGQSPASGRLLRNVLLAAAVIAGLVTIAALFFRRRSRRKASRG